jgi:glycine dehydrogenase subunit 1
MRFLPQTDEAVREMCAVIGVADVAELFRDIPAALRDGAAVDLPAGLPELEVRRILDGLAARNTGATALSFLGAGAYPHFVPAVVDNVLQRAEFYSAYTPYQPEVSQGTLQAIFEFQTMAAMLLGLDVANASLYDGASAAAEAVLMALRVHTKRHKVVVARSLHPQYRQVIDTYLRGLGETELVEVGFGADGRIDAEALARAVDDGTACVVAGYPNFFGVIEDLSEIAPVCAAHGTLLVSATPEALALATLRAPGDCRVAIAVAEGQSLGVPLSYGGPGVGLFATETQHVRNMPGRLVGQAVDGAGRRGYVLTLATREQHIRRERATSNICTNQGLIALAVTVYLSLLGKQGLYRLGRLNLDKAHRAARAVCDGAWKLRFAAPFFNEFAVAGGDATATLRRAREAGIVAGVDLGEWYPELAGTLLLAVTEMHSDADVTRLAEVFRP